MPDNEEKIIEKLTEVVTKCTGNGQVGRYKRTMLHWYEILLPRSMLHQFVANFRKDHGVRCVWYIYCPVTEGTIKSSMPKTHFKVEIQKEMAETFIERLERFLVWLKKQGQETGQ